MQVTQTRIKSALKKVLDPEIGISIVDLGLIYKISVHTDGSVDILMTLTSMGCPLFGVIEGEIKQKIFELGIPKKKISVEVTFDPPWDIHLLSPRARATLGI